MSVENLLLPNVSRSMRNSADAVPTVAVEITIKEMQADHVVPLHLGGADEISNLYPACRACNHYKSTYTVRGSGRLLNEPDTQMKCSATFPQPWSVWNDSTPWKDAIKFLV